MISATAASTCLRTKTGASSLCSHQQSVMIVLKLVQLGCPAPMVTGRD